MFPGLFFFNIFLIQFNLIIFLGILFSSIVGFSQSREKGTIKLIPEIGYASANYYGESHLNNYPTISVSFGVAGDYFFNNR